MSAKKLIESIFGPNVGPNVGAMGASSQPIPQHFREKYKAYSPMCWVSENRDMLESGDKIVLPASALEKLSKMSVQFPIMFQIRHDSDILPSQSHCSVMEFTAPEGSCYLPLWMMDNLGLDPQGTSMVELCNVSLPKGHFVRFQPRENAFMLISNPLLVLTETIRRSYSCLTKGDTIPVEFNNHIYKLNVKEVRPCKHWNKLGPPAICVIETNITFDFEKALDYEEEEEEEEEEDEEEKEEEEDHFGVIWDPIKNAQNAKTQYFETLEESGFHAQRLGKQRTERKNTNQNSNTTDTMVMGVPIIKNPYSPRGLPLRKKKHTRKKEEELVGTMRYIYEIDEHGNRHLVQRLPMRIIRGAESEQKSNDANNKKQALDPQEDKKTEPLKSDESLSGPVRQLKNFLIDICLEDYFESFRKNDCDISYIEDFDDDTLENDIGIKSRLKRRKFLREAATFKKEMDEFNAIMTQRNVSSLVSKQLRKHGILTVDILCNEVKCKLDLNKILKINNDLQCDAIWDIVQSQMNPLHAEDNSGSDYAVEGMSNTEYI
eukprot:390037_1